MKKVLLLVTGSIAAYKALDIIRRLQDVGVSVTVALTKSATEFVTPLSFASISGNEVYTELFSLKDETEMGHIRLTREADLVLLAPATAESISKLATGRADDLVSTILLANDKPLFIAPAMNTKMWENASVQGNVAVLKKQGYSFIEPANGELACKEVGTGKLAAVEDIVSAVNKHFGFKQALLGKEVVITLGGTKEPIDDVRYIGNNSSGMQGYQIAQALAKLGAKVKIISANSLDSNMFSPNMLANCVYAPSFVDMQEQLSKEITKNTFCLVMAAAVSDFRPKQRVVGKIKKTDGGITNLELSQNEDLLKSICKGKSKPPLVVGFAAEQQGSDIQKLALNKMQNKGCDWIVANSLKSMGGEFSDAVLYTKKSSKPVTLGNDKANVAKQLANEILSFAKNN